MPDEARLVETEGGLELLFIGGIEVTVDGEEVDVPNRLVYKGMMLEGVPNLAISIGYTNASWTLKCDLTCEYVCRLLNHMDERGYRQCMPVNDPLVAPEPIIDFNSGYILRSIEEFPKQGSRRPWRLYQNYPLDILTLRYGNVDDGAMRFSPSPSAPHARVTSPASAATRPAG